MNRIEHVSTYYTSLASMQRKFDKYARKNGFAADSINEFEEWKQETRKRLTDLFGMDKFEACDLSAEYQGDCMMEDGIRRESYLLEVEEGVFMPFYILYPNDGKQRYVKDGENVKPACALALHGHCGGGKESIAGRREILAIADAIDKFQYDYGLKLARSGYITICPDARGYGGRREKALQKDEESAYLNGACFQLSHMAEPLGMTVMGMLTFDLMRLIDYIEQRGDFDMKKLLCVGFSGGGMQTLMLAAMDDRVKECVISGYMYGYKDSLLTLNGNCNCNYVPHLWEHVDMGDIGALIAPRKAVIQSCRDDHLNGPRGLVNASEQVEIMRKAYSLFDKEENLIHDIREGGHCFHPEVLDILMG
ncbi:MAG: alpha/beta fold hydrolase [Lachnospiraceae bacterium]|nr:alpha/beta fold hydrolase [Lachnospiraceae bacterium]